MHACAHYVTLGHKGLSLVRIDNVLSPMASFVLATFAHSTQTAMVITWCSLKRAIN